jgi:hypothetical protein
LFVKATFVEQSPRFGRCLVQLREGLRRGLTNISLGSFEMSFETVARAEILRFEGIENGGRSFGASACSSFLYPVKQTHS